MKAELAFFLANFLIWSGVGWYLLFLRKNQKKLETRLSNMEQNENDD